jgi:hypothetical protein
MLEHVETHNIISFYSAPDLTRLWLHTFLKEPFKHNRYDSLQQNLKNWLGSHHSDLKCCSR